MSQGGTFSKRLSNAIDSFWGDVQSGAQTFAREVLPVWTAQQLEVGGRDKLRQPTFNANTSRPRLDSVDPNQARQTTVSGGARSTFQTTDAPGPQGFFGLSNQQLLIGGGAILLLVLVLAPALRR